MNFRCAACRTKTPRARRRGKKNAPGGARTPDPGLIRPMLYQLSYPSWWFMLQQTRRRAVQASIHNHAQTRRSLLRLVGWPSGLRRQFQALVSSEAWVRIPLQSVFASPQHLEVDARRQSKVAHGHAKRPFPKEKKTTTSKRKDK